MTFVMVALFVGSACNQNNNNEFLGVFGILMPYASENATIILMRTYSQENYDEFIPEALQIKESNAEVIISSDSQHVTLSEVIPGRYVDTAGMLKYYPGLIYKLEVKAKDGLSVHAQCVLPGVPIPDPETTPDSFSVAIELDTVRRIVSGYPYPVLTQMYYLRSPTVSFDWSDATGAEAYYWEIGADTSYLKESDREFFIPNSKLFQTEKWIAYSSLVLFDHWDSTTYRGLYNKPDNPWTWSGFYIDSEREFVYTSQLHITAIDRNFIDYTYYNHKSNIRGGYGYFSAATRHKRPITVHVQSKWKQR
ncbi:MAG TPA: DUF4249 family protein [bacterium]|nr:DUF4249 family protein [bacterium]HMW34872.1 DUF4249 family protein [bacterium]HMZ03026.1 DUF4249 family protein [bacterium]HNF85822.1 DUF4249 family protein [bacterium]HNH28509.1 DUF4249 family protein [bacterium]